MDPAIAEIQGPAIRDFSPRLEDDSRSHALASPSSESRSKLEVEIPVKKVIASSTRHFKKNKNTQLDVAKRSNEVQKFTFSSELND